jgi:clan AA aspartic protease (TIGR02281 family)
LRLIIIIVVFLVGIAAGWQLRGFDDVHIVASIEPEVYEREVPADIRTLYAEGKFGTVVRLSGGNAHIIHGLIKDDRSPLVGILVQQFIASYGEYFDGLMVLAVVESRQGNYEAALAHMERADFFATTEQQENKFSLFLIKMTDVYAKDLLVVNDVQGLDALYEQITYSMPEQGIFFLKLGSLRLRLGQYEAAMAPLSQIENHMRYGEEARALIAQTNGEDVLDSLEVLSLETNGIQFIVNAQVDGIHTLRMLIDTGAAMTVVDSSVLATMGYELAGQQRGLFSTVNGVVEAPVISLDQFALGSSSVGPLSVGGLALSLPGSIDGLLGMNFLRHYDFHIDQNAKELHLISER